tara:strand:+ start:903 stop:1151 length:249 start_codon:yes stop_codon:yes gene_type:complete
MANKTKNKKRAGYQNGKLVGGQKKLDINKDGKISGKDFAMMNKGGRVGKMAGGMLKKAKPMNKGGRVNKMAGGMMKTSKKAK